MQRRFIITLNVLVLGLILIGLPNAIHLDLGFYRVFDPAQVQWLILVGAALAGVTNGLAATFWIRRKKEKALCRSWALGYGAVILLQGLLLLEWIHFDWLRDWLQRLS